MQSAEVTFQRYVHTDALQSKLSLSPLLGALTMLFQLEVLHNVESNVMIMNNAFARIWKWSIVSYSPALSRHSASWRKPRKLQSPSIGISPNYEQQPRIRVIRSVSQIWLISEDWFLTSVAESAQLREGLVFICFNLRNSNSWTSTRSSPSASQLQLRLLH
jgi:hypothetical protein